MLDLSRLLPGGFCSLLLSDLGAEVLKVEDTGAGDYLRWTKPSYTGATPDKASAAFLAVNRGKRSIRVNLKDPGGRDVLFRLARSHDVLLESFRPGVMDRLGVGYEQLRQLNPGIIFCAITGYGQFGPYRERSGHDINYLAAMGLLGLSGEQDGPPAQAATQIADLGGGALMATLAILAALRERDSSNEGQFLDVSMADGALSWMAMAANAYFCDGEAPQRGRLPLAGGYVCYRPYECRDGWVALGAAESKFWSAWCHGVEREDLVAGQFDPPGSPTHSEVERIFLSRTREEWRQFASRHDCCLEPVMGLDEALDSEHVRSRGMILEMDEPGIGLVRQLGFPVRFSRSTPVQARPAPGLGADTHAVMRAAGFSVAEIEALEERGAVAGLSTEEHESVLGG